MRSLTRLDRAEAGGGMPHAADEADALGPSHPAVVSSEATRPAQPASPHGEDKPFADDGSRTAADDATAGTVDDPITFSLDDTIRWTAGATDMTPACWRLPALAFDQPAVEAEFWRYMAATGRAAASVVMVLLGAATIFGGSQETGGTTSGIVYQALGAVCLVLAALHAALCVFMPAATIVAQHRRARIHEAILFAAFGLLPVGLRAALAIGGWPEVPWAPRYSNLEYVYGRSFRGGDAVYMLMTALAIVSPARVAASLLLQLAAGALGPVVGTNTAEDFAFRFAVEVTYVAVLLLRALARDREYRGQFRQLVALHSARAEVQGQRELRDQVARTAVPARLLARLVRADAGTAALGDAAEACLVGAAQVSRLGELATGQMLLRTLEGLHGLASAFDAAARVLGLDQATMFGDCYVVTAGLVAGSAASLAQAVRFAVWQAATAFPCGLGLQAAVGGGRAAGGLAGARSLRYVVEGAAVAEAVRGAQRAVRGQALVSRMALRIGAAAAAARSVAGAGAALTATAAGGDDRLDGVEGGSRHRREQAAAARDAAVRARLADELLVLPVTFRPCEEAACAMQEDEHPWQPIAAPRLLARTAELDAGPEWWGATLWESAHYSSASGTATTTIGSRGTALCEALSARAPRPQCAPRSVPTSRGASRVVAAGAEHEHHNEHSASFAVPLSAPGSRTVAAAAHLAHLTTAAAAPASAAAATSNVLSVNAIDAALPTDDATAPPDVQPSPASGGAALDEAAERVLFDDEQGLQDIALVPGMLVSRPTRCPGTFADPEDEAAFRRHARRAGASGRAVHFGLFAVLLTGLAVTGAAELAADAYVRESEHAGFTGAGIAVLASAATAAWCCLGVARRALDGHRSSRHAANADGAAAASPDTAAIEMELGQSRAEFREHVTYRPVALPGGDASAVDATCADSRSNGARGTPAQASTTGGTRGLAGDTARRAADFSFSASGDADVDETKNRPPRGWANSRAFACTVALLVLCVAAVVLLRRSVVTAQPLYFSMGIAMIAAHLFAPLPFAGNAALIMGVFTVPLMAWYFYDKRELSAAAGIFVAIVLPVAVAWMASTVGRQHAALHVRAEAGLAVVRANAALLEDVLRRAVPPHVAGVALRLLSREHARQRAEAAATEEGAERALPGERLRRVLDRDAVALAMAPQFFAEFVHVEVRLRSGVGQLWGGASVDDVMLGRSAGLDATGSSAGLVALASGPRMLGHAGSPGLHAAASATVRSPGASVGGSLAAGLPMPSASTVLARWAAVASLVEEAGRGDLALVQALGDSLTLGGPFAQDEDAVARAGAAALRVLGRLEAVAGRGFTAACVVEEAFGSLVGEGAMRYRVFGVASLHAGALLSAAEAPDGWPAKGTQCGPSVAFCTAKFMHQFVDETALASVPEKQTHSHADASSSAHDGLPSAARSLRSAQSSAAAVLCPLAVRAEGSGSRCTGSRTTPGAFAPRAPSVGPGLCAGSAVPVSVAVTHASRLPPRRWRTDATGIVEVHALAFWPTNE